MQTIEAVSYTHLDVYKRQVWNGCAAVTVTYTFGDKKEVLDGMTVKDWMTYDENGNYVENLGAVSYTHLRRTLTFSLPFKSDIRE